MNHDAVRELCKTVRQLSRVIESLLTDEEPAPSRLVLSDLEQQIVDALRAAVRRLTKDEITAALEAAGQVHGDSTIRNALGRLLAMQMIESSQRKPYGYVLIGHQPSDSERGIDLTDTEQAILAALGDEAMTGEEIAAKAGLNFNSHFRAALTSMFKRAYLNKTCGGYRRGDRGRP